jgi:hypothetical protein
MVADNPDAALPDLLVNGDRMRQPGDPVHGRSSFSAELAIAVTKSSSSLKLYLQF